MRVAVIGLGMVGYEIVKEFKNKYDVTVITRSRKEFFEDVEKFYIDITNRDKLEDVLRKIKPDYVINTAAMTNVDLCEEKKEEAYRINALAVKYLGEICDKLNCYLCHISTDYVFDGEKGNYKEEDEVNPLQYYGYTKAKGEEFLRGYDNVAIVRISVPYCFSPIKKNFFMWVLGKLRNGEKIRVVRDQWITPTFVKELVECLEKIYGYKGILHVGGRDKVSRYEFALKIAEVFNLDKDLIKPVSMNDIGWKAKRPRDTSLNSERAEKFVKLKPLEENLKILNGELKCRSNL